MKLTPEFVFEVLGAAALWTAFVVWLFGLGWTGGLIAAAISLPMMTWITIEDHKKEIAKRLKKLEKIEEAAEISRKLKKLDRLEKAQSR